MQFSMEKAEFSLYCLSALSLVSTGIWLLLILLSKVYPTSRCLKKLIGIIYGGLTVPFSFSIILPFTFISCIFLTINPDSQVTVPSSLLSVLLLITFLMLSLALVSIIHPLFNKYSPQLFTFVDWQPYYLPIYTIAFWVQVWLLVLWLIFDVSTIAYALLAVTVAPLLWSLKLRPYIDTFPNVIVLMNRVSLITFEIYLLALRRIKL